MVDTLRVPRSRYKTLGEIHNVVRSRPSFFLNLGGFSPSDISNLIVDYDASLGITLNGDDVSDWDDQSGNSNDLAQTTASKQPLFIASDSDFNNNPSLSFDALTFEELNRATFTGGPVTQIGTIIIVVK